MRPLPTLMLLLAAAACGGASIEPTKTAETVMNEVSKPYVMLVLAVGTHDPTYVDAYYGPPEWRTEVDAQKPSLAQIRGDARALLARLRATPVPADPLLGLRHHYFVKQLEALAARVDMLEGRTMPFDEESRLLYDAVAPRIPEAQFEATIARIDKLLPGAGPLAARVEELRKKLTVPADKLQAVFAAAIAECRARTLKHIDLPSDESFQIEYVTGKSWSAYNWYKGNFHSLIQVNTDLPITIDRVVHLACHEGYPGHHVYNTLLEKRLVRDRGWTELTVYPLYSPMSLIAEGSADHGIDMAFPGGERLEFERRVLYPLAGLDPALAPTYTQLVEMLDELKHVTNQAARRRLDEKVDAETTAAYLTRYGLTDPARARKLVTFIDGYRSYVINYNVGRDLVRAYVAKHGDGWKTFERVISSPMLASDLVEQ